MLNSIIRTISKPFDNSAGANNSQQQSTMECHQGRTNPSDRVEDGFLLVGQTASERTTVYHSQFYADRTEPGAPPSYTNLQSNSTGLPTYREYSSNTTRFTAPMPPTLHATATHLQTAEGEECGTSHTHSSRSAISDVPFILGVDLTLCNTFRDIRSSNLLTSQVFQQRNYDYDFSIELALLNESYSLEGNR